MQKYIIEGGTHKINIPFPMINKRIKGILPETERAKCWVILEHEKFDNI